MIEYVAFKCFSLIGWFTLHFRNCRRCCCLFLVVRWDREREKDCTMEWTGKGAQETEIGDCSTWT